MKVSEIVKLLGDEERIVIYEDKKCWECRVNQIWEPFYDCRFYSPIEDDFQGDDYDYVCDNCDYFEETIKHHDMYIGVANSVPIKLADKRICGITSRTVKVRITKTSKKTKDVLVFGIQI